MWQKDLENSTSEVGQNSDREQETFFGVFEEKIKQ